MVGISPSQVRFTTLITAFFAVSAWAEADGVKKNRQKITARKDNALFIIE
jgi:hypothetical protein